MSRCMRKRQDLQREEQRHGTSCWPVDQALKLVIMSLIWRSVTKFGEVVIHKAKRNNNLSFSKGKTWQLEDMRVLEVVGVR